MKHWDRWIIENRFLMPFVSIYLRFRCVVYFLLIWSPKKLSIRTRMNSEVHNVDFTCFKGARHDGISLKTLDQPCTKLYKERLFGFQGSCNFAYIPNSATRFRVTNNHSMKKILCERWKILLKPLYFDFCVIMYIVLAKLPQSRYDCAKCGKFFKNELFIASRENAIKILE